jgi:hypothetical protein
VVKSEGLLEVTLSIKYNIDLDEVGNPGCVLRERWNGEARSF